MSKLIYVDTNIYIDYFQNRKDENKEFGKNALMVFRRTISCEFEIVASDWVLEELKKFVETKKIEAFFKRLLKRNKILRIEHDEKDLEDAISHKNWPDKLHIILATKANAECIVTRNLKDFRKLADSMEIMSPEDL